MAPSKPLNKRKLMLPISASLLGLFLYACLGFYATSMPKKLEFIAYGTVDCGGIAPLPGCVYELQEWVKDDGPIVPGNYIKVLIMNPDSKLEPDIDSCRGYQIDDLAYQWSEVPIRIRVRGEPCEWNPNYMFCICDPDDFVRLEP